MRSLRYRDVPPATRAPKSPAERVVREIRRATRKHHSAEERIRIVPEGLLGENSIVALYRSEGIAEGFYYSWLKDFLKAGKRRLSGDPWQPGFWHSPTRAWRLRGSRVCTAFCRRSARSNER